MKNRVAFYYKILRWTAIPLLVLMWLELMTGPGPFKGDLLSRMTLGLLNPADAGKLHSVWLPPITAGIFYLHTLMGVQVVVYRTSWLKPKSTWEVVAFVLGVLAVVQFFWLFYG